MGQVSRLLLFSRRWLTPALIFVAAGAVGSAASIENLATSLYRPWVGERAALSPDGEHLAYTRNEKGELAIYLMAVSRPEKKFRIAVSDDRAVAFSREKSPVRLRFLAWASASRLVFAMVPDWVSGMDPAQSIHALNLDGTGIETIAENKDFLASISNEDVTQFVSRATDIRGFMLGDRTKLLVEARGVPSRGAFSPAPNELFAVDVNSHKVKSLVDDLEEGYHFYEPTGKLRMVYTRPQYSPYRDFRVLTGAKLDRWVDLSSAWDGPESRNFRITFDNYFGERAMPIGVDTTPGVIYFASNVGRDTYGIYALDTTTRRRTPLAIEEPHVDMAGIDADAMAGNLVHDPVSGKLVGVRTTGVGRLTRWIDPALTAMQRQLEQQFSQRTVEILQWDDARTRYLIRVSGINEPGRYYVYLAPEKVVVDVLRTAPWLSGIELHAGTTFEFDAPNGTHLTGYLTFPRRPRLKPTPLLIDFSDGLMGRALPGFDRDAQMLAEMGFVVARVNLRGTSGFGIAHREAIRREGERAAIDDARAVIEWVSARHSIDRKRVATIGRGLGGFLAVRALQLEPSLFRCGVAIDAPLSVQRWLEAPLGSMPAGPAAGALSPYNMFFSARAKSPPPRSPPINFTREARLAYFFGDKPHLGSALSEADHVTQPVMLIVNGSPGSEIGSQNDLMHSRLKRRNIPVEFVQTENPEAAALPGGQAAMFRRIEAFFNLNLYDFDVKVGPVKEVK